MKTNPIFLIALLIVSAFTTFAQSPGNNRSPLTIEQIMQKPENWIGYLPEDFFWSETHQELYFSWNPERDTLPSLYSYSLISKKTEKVPVEEKLKLPAQQGSYNKNRTKKAYIRNGNLFLLDIGNHSEKQLTNWMGQASEVKFAAGDRALSFMKDGNLFTLDLASGTLHQITNFVSGEPKKNKETNEQAKWLENQQMDLFDVLKTRKAMEKARENRSETEKIEQPAAIYTGKKRVTHASLSPSGDFVIYTLNENPREIHNTSVTHWVTESGYIENKSARPKVGSEETQIELGIFDVRNNTCIEIETSAVTGLKDLPEYLSDYLGRMPDEISAIEPRTFNLLGPLWHESIDKAIVSAYSHDNKDRWILLLDAATGNMELLDRQRDEAWIAGPGILGRNNISQIMGWLPDNRSIWFHSEESGYSHLYVVDTESKSKRALTSGNFEVSNAFLSRDNKHFYFTANIDHPGVKHFYRLPLREGNPVRITSMEGNNEVTLSPDEKHLAIRHSYANRPWELYLQENKPGAKPRQITRSTTEAFNTYNWREPEFITFPASDGAEVHARLYRPANSTDNGPAAIFVHGAGYLQNAHKWWSSYFREYMFHNILVDNGYTVLDIDYRGSAGYGRDWRTGIYRHMGGKDLTDHVDGARLLVEKYGIGPGKIGIYGGSYGGFITLMAMFTEPQVFAAGAALRSVTDWAHYNHGYTSNILNTPVDDSLAFRRSSPIYFAEGLEGALLMCHGMVDDNVQFQDIIRLTQRLIELGKDNWELAVYPVESHAFTEPTSWTDEYKRIFKLFERHLKNSNRD